MTAEPVENPDNRLRHAVAAYLDGEADRGALRSALEEARDPLVQAARFLQTARYPLEKSRDFVEWAGPLLHPDQNEPPSGQEVERQSILAAFDQLDTRLSLLRHSVLGSAHGGSASEEGGDDAGAPEDPGPDRPAPE